MDAAQISAACARIGEILRKPNETEADAKEAGKLALNLLEDFLLDHKRQTELLDGIMFDLNARTNRELGR